MGALESSYPTILQGVSEQVPHERLPGQVTEQVNMLSDVVTGVRRRPGCEFLHSDHMPPDGHDGPLTFDKFAYWFGTIGEERVHMYVNTRSGGFFLRKHGATTMNWHTTTGAYLVAENSRNLRFEVVDSSLYVINTEKKVEVTSTRSYEAVVGKNATLFSITAGALNTVYRAHISYLYPRPAPFPPGYAFYTAQYITPDGTTAGDADKATASYIRDQLASQLASWSDPEVGTIRVVRHGDSVIEVVVPRDDITDFKADLSPRASFVVPGPGSPTSYLPSTGASTGVLVPTGGSTDRAYYTYSWEQTAWIEAPANGSPMTYGPGPLRILSTVDMYHSDWEGRTAGDDDSAPPPRFLKEGIVDGLGVYQGRLVVLSGNLVAMSASREPLRFFRSTVTELVDSDTVEVGTSATSAAKYKYALQFDRSLVLFSTDYQSVVPTLSTALTPRNATVLLGSQYASTLTVPPVATGRTFMVPFDRSLDTWGLREFIGSSYQNNQFISTDATQHIPRYMTGKPRFLEVDTGNSVLVAGFSDNPKTMLVQEFLWSDTEKVQQAWHKFVFAVPILAAYFADGELIVVCTHGKGSTGYHLVAYTMDMQSVWTQEDALAEPFLDMRVQVAVVDGVAQLPTDLWALVQENSAVGEVSFHASEGVGGVVGATLVGGTEGQYEIEPSYSHPFIWAGLKYRSSIVPSPPVLRDENEVKISTNKLTILRYVINTRNSSEYRVTVSDRGYTGTSTEVGTVTWDSPELALEQSPTSNDAYATVPCRTSADSTRVEIHTDGGGELNIIGIEYVLRYHQKIRRM